MSDTPRAGAPFRRHVVDELDRLGAELVELRADHDVDARAFAGLLVTRRVVMNLKSGTALAGVIVRHDGPLVELADVALLGGSDPQPVDGRVVVERADVDFIQIP